MLKLISFERSFGEGIKCGNSVDNNNDGNNKNISNEEIGRLLSAHLVSEGSRRERDG